MASLSVTANTTHRSPAGLPTAEREALATFVAHASTDEIIERLARTELRLQELDERLRIVKRLVDDAEL